MACAAECLLQPPVSACEHVAACSHGPPNQHRLACELVVHGDEGVVGWEGTGGALAVHQQLHQLPVNHVLLYLQG
jgi:hypothetical protein